MCYLCSPLVLVKWGEFKGGHFETRKTDKADTPVNVSKRRGTRSVKSEQGRPLRFSSRGMLSLIFFHYRIIVLFVMCV